MSSEVKRRVAQPLAIGYLSSVNARNAQTRPAGLIIDPNTSRRLTSIRGEAKFMTEATSAHDIVELVRSLQRRLDEQSAEIAALKAERRIGVRHSTAGRRTPPVSRAQLLKAAGLGVAVVATAGLGVESELGTAKAANGSGIAAGGQTTAEASTTLQYDGPDSFQGTIFLANGTTNFGATDTAYPSAIGGWAGTTGVSNGVYGYTENAAGNGVLGVQGAGSVGTGNGVLGSAASTHGAGVMATNSLGTALLASSQSENGSATAILGVLTSTSPGSYSAAVRGQNNGTGGLGIGVWGSHAGSGWGGYFTAAAGIGVNAAGGSGTGVNANGAMGVTALGDTVGVAASSTGGRGVVAAGNAAQIQLTPGGGASPPNSGRTGDIYVDATGRPLFCAGGTTWQLLTLGTGPAGQAVFSSPAITPTATITSTAKGDALSASSAGGYGAELKGGSAPLRLIPSKVAGHPKAGKHQRGELMVDSNGHLFLCASGGTPGRWRQVKTL